MSSIEFGRKKEFCGKKIVDRYHHIPWTRQPVPSWLSNAWKDGERKTALSFVLEARHQMNQTPKNSYAPEHFANAAKYLGLENQYKSALHSYKPAQAFEIVTRHIEI